MGDIIKRVKICAGGTCAIVPALVDTGATRSVIGRDLAAKLKLQVYVKAVTIDVAGKKAVDAVAAPLSLELLTKGCYRVATTGVIVDDGLARKAGPRAKMILGRDYLLLLGLVYD